MNGISIRRCAKYIASSCFSDQTEHSLAVWPGGAAARQTASAYEKSQVVIGGLLLCNYDNISLLHGDAGNYLQVVRCFAYSTRCQGTANRHQLHSKGSPPPHTATEHHVSHLYRFVSPFLIPPFNTLHMLKSTWILLLL